MTDSRTTPAILVPIIAAVNPSDLGDNEIEVAIVEFGVAMNMVVKDVTEKVVVGLEVSVVSCSGTVFVVLLMFPALERS